MFDVKKQKTARQQQVAAKEKPQIKKTKNTKAFQLSKVFVADALVVHLGGRDGRREGGREWASHLPIGKQQNMIKSRSTTTITTVLSDGDFAEQATRKDFTISDAPRERQTHTHTPERQRYEWVSE
jgi:hypothetical protein